MYKQTLEKHNTGAVAVKQALFHFHGQTYEQVASLTNVSRRTAYAHANASNGSGVVPWDNRTDDEQLNAVMAADELLNATA